MPDVKGYKLPNHDETYMYADEYARAELLKRAPSGYGLGEMNGKTCTDANTATEIGFYSMSGSGALNVPAGYEYGQLSVTRRNADIYHTLKSEGNEVHRHSSDGGVTWQPWSVSRGVDVVVAQGTSGGWTYRKWSSGIAECWGVIQMPKTNYAAVLPFQMANCVAILSLNQHNNVTWTPNAIVNGVCTNQSNTTTITLYTTGTPSEANTYGVSVYVFGNLL